MAITGNVLITGGSGTLGRAILRQAGRDKWDAVFTVASRSESKLAAMKRRYPAIRTVIADVRDADALLKIVPGHETVIHAAALKRIPECEVQPVECYLTNVYGSANVARACQLQGVKTAIAISTDKACLSATVYGASKLMMEGIWRSQPLSTTRFVGVRYGNVVGSNGSVIPLWREQHRKGQMITITDNRMTRFWMSPTDAVKLVDDAWNKAMDGDVFIPKMASMSLVSLAETVCPGAKIAETGLRSTEKLHEDLVHTAELANESVDTYRLTSKGNLGHTYTSLNCPRLTPDAFRVMLKDAEELETVW